jgi:DNA-directed RNA polymerase subunit K/omega
MVRMDEVDQDFEQVQEQPSAQPAMPDVPAEPGPPVGSRFLFVDIAALRAKQLRRGARPRLGTTETPGSEPHKAERVAMEEVQRGLVYYEVRVRKPQQPEEQA